MAWNNLPADASTNWTDLDFARQFAEAIHERYQAVAGRVEANRDPAYWVDPYAANSWALDCAATPPATPADADRYAVAAGATGDWAGEDGNLATWDEGAAGWTFAAPTAGWGYELDDGRIVYPVAGGWTEGGHWARIVLAQGLTVNGARNAPPASPADGAVYAVLSAPTGPWAGHADTLATWNATAEEWTFATPGPYMTIRTADGIVLTYGTGAAAAWAPWRLQAADNQTETRGRTSWYDLQKAAENLLAGRTATGAFWADTVAYPAAEGFDGLADIPRLTLAAAWGAAGLATVDEQLDGGANTPPTTTGWGWKDDGRRFGVWHNPTGDWAGHADALAQWDYNAGSPSWSFETPSADYTVAVAAGGDTQTDAPYCPPCWRYDATAGRWMEHAAGFTRKHPRELAALGEAGAAGQRARFVDRCGTITTTTAARRLNAAPSATPPASPSAGYYAVAASATGDWTGHDGELATWTGSAWSFSSNTDRAFWRVSGSEAAYVAVGDPPSAADDTGRRTGWAKYWDYLAEAMTSTPPASPADGDVYAIGYAATGAWAGHDFKIATWDATAEEWTFTATTAAAPATAIRVHPSLRAESGFVETAGRMFLRTAAGWADIAAALFDYNATAAAWDLSTDQNSPPDTVEAVGRIRRGDYIGPWIFNELADFLDVLAATAHPAVWNPDPADPATIIDRSWDSGGTVTYESAANGPIYGPYQFAYGDGTASRSAPWAKVSAGLHPGRAADLEWYFFPRNQDDPPLFYAFGEGWTQDVYNLWKSSAAAALAEPLYSDGRFEALTRPTDYPDPADWRQGYISTTSASAARQPILVARHTFTRQA